MMTLRRQYMTDGLALVSVDLESDTWCRFLQPRKVFQNGLVDIISQRDGVKVRRD